MFKKKENTFFSFKLYTSNTAYDSIWYLWISNNCKFSKFVRLLGFILLWLWNYDSNENYALSCNSLLNTNRISRNRNCCKHCFQEIYEFQATNPLSIIKWSVITCFFYYQIHRTYSRYESPLYFTRVGEIFVFKIKRPYDHLRNFVSVRLYFQAGICRSKVMPKFCSIIFNIFLPTPLLHFDSFKFGKYFMPSIISFKIHFS